MSKLLKLRVKEGLKYCQSLSKKYNNYQLLAKKIGIIKLFNNLQKVENIKNHLQVNLTRIIQQIENQKVKIQKPHIRNKICHILDSITFLIIMQKTQEIKHKAKHINSKNSRISIIKILTILDLLVKIKIYLFNPNKLIQMLRK